MKLRLGLGAFSLTVLSSDARPTFVARVPNGNRVPGVVALGHVNTVGGGATNAFGEAFGAAGYEWTRELCQADSDGDGASNGEELGDPCCTWTSLSGFDSAAQSSPAQSSPTPPGVANSFTESQLASMTCGAEADVNVIAPSGSAWSTSDSESQSSLFGSNSSSSSGSSDDVVGLEDQPHVSFRPELDDTSSHSATSDANQLKTFVYCFSIAVIVAAN